MTNLIDSVKKGPMMSMTLECETEFPKALKNLMLSMGLGGAAIYKGYPYIDEEDGIEYWWVELHLYEDKEDDHKYSGTWMFTNPVVHPSFFDSARCAAWSAIEELGERLKWRLHNTQKNLKEANEEVEALQMDLEETKTLKTTIKTEY